MNLSTALAAAQQVVHEEAASFFAEYKPKVEDIDTWSADIIARLEEYCLRPGKAIRPLLIAITASMSLNISLEEALKNAEVRALMLAFEMTHKRILMADDIADQDELRNEEPAFHIKLEDDLAKRSTYKNLPKQQLIHFTRSYTEVAGIWLQTLSFAVLEKAHFTLEKRPKIMETILKYVYERTPAGWYILLDQAQEKLSSETSMERFLKGLELVTGEYTFVAPLRLGSILGGKEHEFEKAIAEFGANAGLLFQITDDRIGLFGDPSVSGKPVGNDLREGKKTLYVQYAYQLGNDEQKAELQSIVGNQNVSVPDLQWVQEIVRELGAYQKVEDEIQKYLKDAKQALGGFFDHSSRSILEEMIEYIAKRQK
jgi:geranylgeranyl pyrophosphate synthase